MPVSTLHRQSAPDLAYRLEQGASGLPAVLLLGGFASDMNGTKGQWLSSFCAARGQTLVRFDYSGHGISGGAFIDGTIATWLQDALDIVDAVTSGPLILIGSSMGGWIGLHVALRRADRITGFIGIAAAPDFTREVLARIGPAQQEALHRHGHFPLPDNPGFKPRLITARLLEDGEKHCLLDGPIPIECPVRLIQGMKDDEVPWRYAGLILDKVTGADKRAYLQEEGDHRLVRDEDFALLGALVDELSARDKS